MTTDMDALTLEVAPGELKRVGECSDADLVSSALVLLLSDDADPAVWYLEFARVEVVLMEKLYPTRDVLARKGLATLKRALANLPEDAREEAAMNLGGGIRRLEREGG